MKIKETYLREIEVPERFGTNKSLEIVDFSNEELKKDESYWKKHQRAKSVRYFELREKK